ncbi:hypothetical protein KAV79_04705 [Candidatus Aerophobetes bacterium]|nr:hypothetical protein [Candidatus Aerophobetes bacterium]
MRGAEGQVLKVVRELKLANEKALSRKMGVSSEYVKEICEGLIKDGYLLKIEKGYKLTPEGERLITPVKIRGPIPVLKGGL